MLGKDVEVKVVDDVEVNVSCYECGEQLKIENISTTGYPDSTTLSIDVEVSPHKCKKES